MLVLALDLSRTVVLERFQLNIALSNLSDVFEWICRLLRTITSPVFNEFVIKGLYGWDLWNPKNINGWNVVDELLSALAEGNPDFRVVFKSVFLRSPDGGRSTFDEVRSLVASHLPLVSLKGLVKFEHVPDAEERSWELRYLYLE